jgi:CheY-like chemotaxis protein
MALILVIDDYQPILELLEISLSQAGHEVMAASGGAVGLELAGERPPDLVLVDVDMPGMDGLTVCGKLKRTAGTKEIPVLLMTGRPCAQRLASAQKAGAFGVLSKPFVFDQLLDEITRAVSGGRA